MKTLIPVLVLVAAGCLSVETRKTIDERRATLQDAMVRLESIKNVEDPAYDKAKSAVQLAEAQLATSMAEAVQERTEQGLKYVDTGLSIVKPFAAFHPLIGAGVTALTMVVNALRKKEEANG